MLIKMNRKELSLTRLNYSSYPRNSLVCALNYLKKIFFIFCREQGLAMLPRLAHLNSWAQVIFLPSNVLELQV